MEVQGTAIILARATELRLKIRNSINTATNSPTVTSQEISDDRPAINGNGVSGSNEAGTRRVEADVSGKVEEDDEAVRLFNICDAIESLENQLSSLQDLQQQQRYEKEAALSEIEHSRKILLDELKLYKGKDLKVLHETLAFAGETLQNNHDLVLPPYPSRSLHSSSLDNGYFLHYSSGRKSVSNGPINVSTNDSRKEPTESERKQSRNGDENSRNGLGSFISKAAKSVVTIVGIISILHLSGFRPKFGGKLRSFKVLSHYQHSAEENRTHNDCPPGKILVMENGEAQCIVKERIEVPFSSVMAKPDVNYGSG